MVTMMMLKMMMMMTTMRVNLYSNLYLCTSYAHGTVTLPKRNRNEAMHQQIAAVKQTGLMTSTNEDEDEDVELHVLGCQLTY